MYKESSQTHYSQVESESKLRGKPRRERLNSKNWQFFELNSNISLQRVDSIQRSSTVCCGPTLADSQHSPTSTRTRRVSTQIDPTSQAMTALMAEWLCTYIDTLEDVPKLSPVTFPLSRDVLTRFSRKRVPVTFPMLLRARRAWSIKRFGPPGCNGMDGQEGEENESCERQLLEVSTSLC